MSDSIICPVCDTPNEPDTQYCEACGERLLDEESEASKAPSFGEPAVATEDAADTLDGDGAEDVAIGEVDAAEQDDSGDVPEAGFDPEFEPRAEGELDTAFDAETAGFDGGTEVSEGDDLGFEDVGEGADASNEEATADSEEESEFRPVLYSSVDGRAYYEGSPEFDEGFGPHGEELVPEPPEADGGQPAEADLPMPPAGSASEAFSSAFQPREPKRPEMDPLPTPGTLDEPATLTLYVNREPVVTHAVDTDETLIGRRDPVSDSYPDLDLSEFDGDALVSRKHAYVYRQNRNYTLYVVSHAGTQLNSELLSLGDRRPLKDGDVIVIAGAFAIKFAANT